MATPRTPRHLAMQALGYYDGSEGYGQGQEAARYNALTPEQKAQVNAAAAMPATPALVEPLHQYEKSALSGLANTGGLDNGAMGGALASLQAMLEGNPNFLNQAGQQVQAGTAAVTPEEVEARRNPYATALKSSLSKSAERLRAQLTGDEGLRGARSFGDTATGVRQGMVDEQVLQGEANIDYQTFADAMNQINTERGRNLQGGQIYGGLGGTSANIAQSIFGMGSDLKESRVADLMRQLGSGEYIRNYQQGINTKLENDILASQQDPVKKILTELAAIQGNAGSVVPGKVSTESKIAGIASTLAGLAGQYGGGSGGMYNVNSNPASALPWLS